MFPIGPRQRQVPMRPPHPFQLMNRPTQPQQTQKSNLLAMFQDTEGKLDIGKITTTAQQINQLYGQVSPMISKFIKK